MIKIYLTNLKDYNEGRLNGEWIDLPIDEDELKNKYNKIIGKDEYFITDYEIETDNDISYNDLSLGEYENIFELNNLLQDLEYEDLNKAAAMIEESICDNLYEAVEHLDEYDLLDITGEEYEEQFCEDCGYFDCIPSWLMNYVNIDYESMAQEDDYIYDTSFGLLKIR